MVTNDTNGGIAELQLPPQSGPRVKLAEKVYAPVKEYPKVLNTKQLPLTRPSLKSVVPY